MDKLHGWMQNYVKYFWWFFDQYHKLIILPLSNINDVIFLHFFLYKYKYYWSKYLSVILIPIGRPKCNGTESRYWDGRGGMYKNATFRCFFFSLEISFPCAWLTRRRTVSGEREPLVRGFSISWTRSYRSRIHIL